MKKIGLIGGMSWESSLEYYKLLNTLVRERLGGYHSANCIMESVDFAEVERLQHLGDWNKLCDLMRQAATNLQQANAECVVLCTNTMHKCVEEINDSLKIPFLHIAQATGERILSQNLRTVLLLGTRFTMEQDFLRSHLNRVFDIDVIIPSEKDRMEVHNTIYTELVHGKIMESSRLNFKRIIEDSKSLGAQGVILGCTEIPLLISESDISIPAFNTTRIHVEYALEFALS